MSECKRRRECQSAGRDGGARVRARGATGPLEEYVGCIYDNRLKAHCYVRMASDLFKDAISNLTETSYKTALHALKECRRPIEEAKRLAGA